MAYVPTESRLGLKAFTAIDTATAVPFGTIVRGHDSASGFGGGEFIYLPGVASTVVGSLVAYDPINKTTTLITNTANQGKPLAVAMSACTAANFGWYQVAGVAVVKKSAVKFSPGVKLYISATAGRIKSLVSAGVNVWNAVTVNAATVASATSTINVLINRPASEGSIT